MAMDLQTQTSKSPARASARTQCIAAPASWALARETYELALANLAIAQDNYSRAYQTAAEATLAPASLHHMTHYAGHRYEAVFQTEHCIDEHFRTLPWPECVQDRDLARQALKVWQEELDAAQQVIGVPGFRAAAAEAGSSVRAARDILISTPAPDVTALVVKLELLVAITYDVCSEFPGNLYEAGAILTDPADKPAAYTALMLYFDALTLDGRAPAVAELRTAGLAAYAKDVAESEAQEAQSLAEEKAGIDSDGFNAAGVLAELQSEGMRFEVQGTEVYEFIPAPEVRSARLVELLHELRDDPSKVQAVQWHARRGAK
jgi:hypothetical protein